jgi:prophage antirepressor-like protein
VCVNMRCRRIRKQRAIKAQRDKVVTMNAKIEPEKTNPSPEKKSTRKPMVRGELLHESVRNELLKMLSNDGLRGVGNRLRQIMSSSGMDSKHMACASEMLHKLQSSPDSRFGTHWKALLEACAQKRGKVMDVPRDDCGTEERAFEFNSIQYQPDPEERPEPPLSTSDTDIVERPTGQATTTASFNGQQVRIAVGEDGGPVFVAKDLVEAVGAEWKTGKGGSIEHIPEDFKGAYRIGTLGGAQLVTCLTEAGMNMYLFRSDKPAAIPWQRHLAEDVLPTIRKTGCYVAPGAQPTGLDPAITQLLTQQSQMMGSVLQGLTNLTLAIASKGQRKAPSVPAPPPAQLPLATRDRRSHWQDDDARTETAAPTTELVRLAEQDQKTERKVTSAMIKRLAGVIHGMDPVEYGARMSTAFHAIDEELKKYGHDSRDEFEACRKDGRRFNTLDWFDRIGVLGIVRKIIEKLYKQKQAAKAQQ